jgi:hypothetical protein
MGAQSSQGRVQVVHGKGDDRETPRLGILGRARFSLQEGQKDAVEIKVWLPRVVGQEGQTDHVPVKVDGRW